ncbi:DUF2207 domain-containing protein [Candidatus Magnetominusculus xianensis]|uniref:DUF2207 domain-containing protein n=1 Tax=Candidatus Magnetominusculus xianensis TaxID=1748249 RepID=A0ABR5SIN5_9BACT|nr:DUF2207 domain-containing protein [Candidatus Magnetominusculus xianensis]KWT91080.1 hypothetical protein ASN18_0904 [Candidatus Magnetominusculus xianensis]MBF0403275.1 DUF2207 domain-containing protein [Nitrospirota bacterium]
MKRLILMAFFLLLASTASAELYLNGYEAVFEAAQNRVGEFVNVQAKLRITYKTDQPLSSGFKFVGSGKISNVMVTDDTGRPVRYTVEKLKENKISFSFPAITSGSKTIVIIFVMEDAIKNGLLYDSFDASWVGKWQIPVNNAVYTFIFPRGFNASWVDTNFASFNKITVDDRQAIQITQPLLAESVFSMKVKPSLGVPSFGGHSSVFFLLALTAAVLLILRIIINIKNLPDSARLDSRELTPAEVAYLKKGLKHSICVGVFDLLQLGRLIKTPPNSLQSLKPDNTLYAHEMLLMEFFKTSATLTDLFRDKELRKGYEEEIINSLSRKGCLKEAKADMAAARTIIWTSALAVIIMVAAGKFSGVSAFYLILSLIVPVIGIITGLILYKRRPKSGRARYMLEKWEATVENQSFVVREGNPFISYGVAILGLSIIAGTVFDDYLGYVSYARAQRGESSSGCSGCSSGVSSGDSGGSDGGSGGCGGCGGGGGD